MGRKLTWDSDVLLTINVDPLHWKRVRDVMMLIFVYPIFIFIEWCIRWYTKGETYYKKIAEPFLIKCILWTIGLSVLAVVVGICGFMIWVYFTGDSLEY